MKSLYLNETSNLIVEKDGASLWIQQDKKGTRVPFRFVNRVVITGNVNLNSSILLQFAAQGAIVTFLDNRGNRQGLLAAPGPVHPDHLEERIQDSEWLEKARNAFSAWEKQAGVQTLSRMIPEKAEFIKSRGLNTPELNRLLWNHICQKHDPNAFHAVFNPLNAMVRSLILKLLIQYRINPHEGIVRQTHNFGLVEDFNQVLRRETQRLAFLILEKNPSEKLFEPTARNRLSAKGRFLVTRRFELRKKNLENRARNLIHKLLHLVRE